MGSDGEVARGLGVAEHCRAEPSAERTPEGSDRRLLAPIAPGYREMWDEADAARRRHPSHPRKRVVRKAGDGFDEGGPGAGMTGQIGAAPSSALRHVAEGYAMCDHCLAADLREAAGRPGPERDGSEPADRRREWRAIPFPRSAAGAPALATATPSSAR